MKFFSLYLTINLVLTAAVLLLILSSPALVRFKSALQLRLHYAVMFFALMISIGAMLKSGGEIFEPVVKVWSASGKSNFDQAMVAPSRGLMQIHTGTVPVSADYFFLFMMGLSAGAAIVGIWHLSNGYRNLQRLLKSAVSIRRVGKVQVLISDEVQVPFSYRAPGRAYVVLPQYLLTNQNSFSLAVAHELQHHRQGDTQWAYFFLLARAICVVNPFVHFWNSWIGEIQEFACDEALVGRQSRRAQDYARCLIEVAETAWVQGSVPVGATGMILLNRGNLLNRRIQVMFKEKKPHGYWAGLSAFMVIALLLTATAFAAKGLVQDRRVSLAQAQEMVRKSVPADSVFPVVVNEEVLKYLNHYIGTREGREKMRAGLRRMENYRLMVSSKIADYQAPPELMAIPLIESGYKNLPERNVEGWGAGLWMFIASTARAYGLRVNDQVDQRMNETLLTDAAMRYLLANRFRFSDWQLSLLAYNAGENAVQQAINETGSRDPWVLVRNSGLNAESKNYLPKVMAAILIMKNPSTVE